MKEEEDGSYLENGLSASEERATKKARKFKKKKFKRKKKTKVTILSFSLFKHNSCTCLSFIPYFDSPIYMVGW